MTHTEAVVKTIEELRKDIASGMFDAAEIRDIEAAIAMLTEELANVEPEQEEQDA